MFAFLVAISAATSQPLTSGSLHSLSGPSLISWRVGEGAVPGYLDVAVAEAPAFGIATSHFERSYLVLVSHLELVNAIEIKTIPFWKWTLIHRSWRQQLRPRFFFCFAQGSPCSICSSCEPRTGSDRTSRRVRPACGYARARPSKPQRTCSCGGPPAGDPISSQTGGKFFFFFNRRGGSLNV